jgi:O-antigen/teichoic acid export membrane protein
VYGRVLLLVAAIGVLMSTLLSLAAPRLAVLAASRSYGGAEVFVPPLALSATLGAVYFVVCIGAFLEGKSLFNLLAYLSGIGVTVIANLVLVGLGAPAVGIAWANCGGQAAAVVCMAILSQRVHPIPFPFARTAVLLAGGGLVAVAGGALAPTMAPGALAGAALGVMAAFGLAAWYAILLPAERRALRAMHRG